MIVNFRCAQFQDLLHAFFSSSGAVNFQSVVHAQLDTGQTDGAARSVDQNSFSTFSLCPKTITLHESILQWDPQLWHSDWNRTALKQDFSNLEKTEDGTIRRNRDFQKFGKVPDLAAPALALDV